MNRMVVYKIRVAGRVRPGLGMAGGERRLKEDPSRHFAGDLAFAEGPQMDSKIHYFPLENTGFTPFILLPFKL